MGSCDRGSLHGWGHVWGHPSDNGATHSGKGSICSKLIVRQGSVAGWGGSSLVMMAQEPDRNWKPEPSEPFLQEAKREPEPCLF